jgi:hypothetical protein
MSESEQEVKDRLYKSYHKACKTLAERKDLHSAASSAIETQSIRIEVRVRRK